MPNDLRNFLKKNKQIIITTVLFNAFFLIVVMISLSLIFDTSIEDLYEKRTTDVHKEEGHQVAQEEAVVRAVSKANPAVVSIVATRDLPEISEEERRFFEFFAPHLELPENDPGEQEIGGGSGFFVSPDGMVITNRHVVENDSLNYSVVTNEGEKLEASVVATDSVYDVAVLDVEISDAPYLEFGSSENLELGQSVIAIGNALSEFSNSITSGIVSGLSRSIVAGSQTGRSELLENVIQTDASINPGNSGGPLLDLKGNVIGVNVAMARGSENIGFAVPSDVVSPIVDSVKEHGEIIRPFLGVRYAPVDEQTASREDLPVSHGVIIVSGGIGSPAVMPGTPADVAGLREGDIIVEYNDTEINSEVSFARLIRESEVGETVTLKVVRGEEEIAVEVTLERAPNDL
ncbi:MAG: trypsin-like peptidase domain-containing protein [Candidatus Campbellbacteria bacterium]|nr:trypsin-like peptidase domain-containing protein [Candidatus Campbellbacteria bacterium]